MSADFAQEDHAEWAALYAAGALPPADQARYERHLAAGCPECVAELRRFERVVTALAAAVPTIAPAAATRETLLERLAQPVPGTSPLRSHLEPGERQAEGGSLSVQRASEASWEPAAVEGVQLRVLFVDRAKNQFTALVRMAPGTAYPSHIHSGPEECLVLEGDLDIGDLVLGPGDYQRAPEGSRHGVQRTERGCLLFITSSLTDVFDSAGPQE